MLLVAKLGSELVVVETQSGVLEDVIATAAVSMPATHRSLIDQVALQRMPDG